MKTIMLAIVLLIASFTSEKAQAQYLGDFVQMPIAGLNNWATNFTPLISNTTRQLAGISIANNTSVSLAIAITGRLTASSADIQRMFIPPGLPQADAVQNNPMIYYPIKVQPGYRISFKGYSSTAKGNVSLNIFYN